MEEIYTLLQERIESVDEVKKKAVPLDTALSIADPDKEVKDSDIADLTHAIGQAKRLEKFRIIKENELLEVIFGLKCFDNNQKLKFQAKSYEIMKNIRQDFNYEKYKYTGETKDIAKLYLNFFITLRLEGKVNDLKKAYANNKFMGYPIISALLKWLVEIARKCFQGFLEEKNRDILNWTLAKKKKAAAIAASAQKLAQSTILTRPQSTTKQRMQSQTKILGDQLRHRASPDEIELEKYLVSGNNNDMLLSGSPKSSDCKAAVLIKSSKKEHIKYGRSQTNPKEVSSGLDMCIIPDHAQLQISSVNLKDGKFLRRGPELYKQNKNLVHIFVSATNQASSHLDVLEDLDQWQTNIMIPQLSSMQKTIKKNRETNLVTIDLEKKKELVGIVYRTLYYRNLDIDRGITNFQTKLAYKEKVHYDPLNKDKRAESYCENYTINFRKRFPHVVCNMSNSPVHHATSKNHRVKLSKGRNPLVLSLTQANQSQDTVLNDSPTVYPLSPKNLKPLSSKTVSKKESESPLLISKVQSSVVNNQHQNPTDTHEHNQNSSQRINQDSFSESPTKILSELEDVHPKKKVSPGLGFGYRSEHHFRIKKRISVLHENKLENEKAFKSMMSKPNKLEHPANWTSTEGTLSKIDNPSDRNSLPQTVSSRREMSNGFSKNHPEETFSRQKGMRSSIANQKMRLWSTEKPKHPSTFDDLTAKSVVHAKSSYTHLEEGASYKSKEDHLPHTEEDAMQIKAVYRSQLVSPKHEEGISNIDNFDSVDCTKMNCYPSFQDNSGEVSESADQVENLKGKGNLNTKPLKIILKLYPKHHKYYSEPFTIPQREKS